MAKSPKKNSAGKAANTAAPRHGLKGVFITLEGGEGAGKSSQMSHLKEKLEKLGKQVVTSREPGGSPGAEAVRHVLLSGAAESFGPEMEAILFSAARADHVDTVIRPALEDGKVVISDRFFDSTRVYQGVSGKVNDSFVRRLERVACGDTWPDLTIIIDLDPVEGLKRAHSRRSADEVPDRFEKESLQLQEMRREAFLKIAKDEPQRCVVIDGSGSPEAVSDRIWMEVATRFDLDGKKPAANTGVKKRPEKKSTAKPKLVSHKKLTARKAKPKAEQNANG